MADSALLARAADCYRRAGFPSDAARCYRDAGSHAKAAEVLSAAGDHVAAADEYRAGGMVDEAIWLLAHVGERVDLARRLAASHALDHEDGSPASSRLRLMRDLALARCDVADGGRAAMARAMTTVQRAASWLQDPVNAADLTVQTRAVDVAVAADRYDHAALVHAAAARSGSWGAFQRWQAWHRSMAGSELPVPERLVRQANQP